MADARLTPPASPAGPETMRSRHIIVVVIVLVLVLVIVLVIVVLIAVVIVVVIVLVIVVVIVVVIAVVIVIVIVIVDAILAHPRRSRRRAASGGDEAQTCIITITINT